MPQYASTIRATQALRETLLAFTSPASFPSPSPSRTKRVQRSEAPAIPGTSIKLFERPSNRWAAPRVKRWPCASPCRPRFLPRLRPARLFSLRLLSSLSGRYPCQSAARGQSRPHALFRRVWMSRTMASTSPRPTAVLPSPPSFPAWRSWASTAPF